MTRLKLNEMFKDAFTLSPLMTNREKIDTETIIKYHPDKISINAIDTIEVDEETVFVYTFEEEPTKFAYAGTVLKGCFNSMVENYSMVEINEALKEEPFTVKLSTSKTKDNKPITKIEKV